MRSGMWDVRIENSTKWMNNEKWKVNNEWFVVLFNISGRSRPTPTPNIIHHSLLIKNICRGTPTHFEEFAKNVGAGLDQPRKKHPRWDSFASNGSVLNKDRNGGNINGEKTK